MKSILHYSAWVILCTIIITSCAKNKDLTEEQRNRANENQRKYNSTYESEQKKN